MKLLIKPSCVKEGFKGSFQHCAHIRAGHVYRQPESVFIELLLLVL